MEKILYFFEGDWRRDFYPLSLSHTIAELRCGILTLGEKWQFRIAHSQVRIATETYLSKHISRKQGMATNNFSFSDSDHILFIDPRFIPNRDIVAKLEKDEGDCAVFIGDTLVAVNINSANKSLSTLQSDNSRKVTALYEIAADLPQVQVESRQLSYLWDLVNANDKQITDDFLLLKSESDFEQMKNVAGIDKNCLIYNPEDVFVGEGTSIDGQVVLDAREGPIYIGKQAYIAPHTRVEGPAFIGSNSQLLGGRIRSGCSFGVHCRVGGEVEKSIFQGYSNKYHDGFIGHTYLGEWVNLGALTTNSDLKNNYGKITVELAHAKIDTGYNKIGSFIGDHTKTGIGTLLNTGMVIGFAANLFGGGMISQKHLASFTWGSKDGFVEYLLPKACETASTVMNRRKSKFSQADLQLFEAVFSKTSPHRQIPSK